MIFDKQKYMITASILAADFTQLGSEVNNVLKAGASGIHFDVMDNHYVPNLTFGAGVCKAIKNIVKEHNAFIDVHLMTYNVDTLIPQFADAGANSIVFHPESTMHIDRSIQLIKSYGIKAGLVINPATPLNILEYILNELDIILIMSVNPGFGMQKFIEYTLKKIQTTKQMIDAINKKILLQVDGGVNSDNIQTIANAGADFFVVGSALFNSDNYAATLEKMYQQLKFVV